MAQALRDAEVSVHNRVLDQGEQIERRTRHLERMKAGGYPQCDIDAFEAESARQNALHQTRIRDEIDWRNKLKIKAKATGVRFGAVVDVYSTLKDILEFTGDQFDESVEWAPAYFYEPVTSSTFILKKGGSLPWSASPKALFVAGPLKGTEKTLTSDQCGQFEDAYHKKYGKYVPPALWRGPRFIPGTHRTQIPLVGTDGTDLGYIDEDGPHYHPFPRPAIF